MTAYSTLKFITRPIAWLCTKISVESPPGVKNGE